MKLKLHQLALLALIFCFSIPAQAVSVALELQLMIDTSGSVSQAEFELQRDGYVAAFQDSSVQSAIASSIGGIAVSVGYFSTTATPGVPTDPMGTLLNPRIDWMHLTSATDATNFATLLSALPNTDNDPVSNGGTGETNIADGIRFGINSLAANSFEGQRRVIDISSDGVQNLDIDNISGDACLMTVFQCTDFVTAQRDLAQDMGITINGLAITDPIPEIEDYFNAFVITDDGFVLATDFDDSFADIITAKINSEILGTTPVPLPAGIWLFGASLIGMHRWLRRN